MENSIEIPQKIKHRTITWSSDFISAITYLKEIESL